MCVANPLRRTPSLNSGGSLPPANDCSGQLNYDLNARIASGVDPALQSGVAVWCQYWSRDPQGPSATSLTNALTFTIQ